MTAPDLSGTVVALTGAGGRLGRVLARHLLVAGATVAGLDAQVPDDPPDDVHFIEADLTSEDAVAKALDRIQDEVGPLGALIHTVGMWAGTPFVETDLADWRKMLDVNLTSAFLTLRGAARRMEAGRLVAIASKQGADGGVAEQAAYSASKAGVVRLVEAVAAEYAGRITAAAVAPSTILFGGEDDDAAGVSVEAVAALCVYLCGPGGSVHNGTVLRAYGA